MHTLLRRTLIINIGILGLSILLFQCAWFKGESSEVEIIKPKPVGGYEVLSTRIHYPRSIREQGIEGTVTVNAFVSSDGAVTETRIVHKLDPDLDRIAANAIKRTLFEPATRDGTPVDVWISIPVIFALKDWQVTSTPFSMFEMIIQPSPAYQSFEVKIIGHMKSKQDFPVRFEFLLPLNADKTWVKAGGEPAQTGKVKDENGEWLIFQINDEQLEWGFIYHPLNDQGDHKFRYKFALNHPLPNWEMAVIYGAQQLRFSQEPSQITEQEDGIMRFSYDLERLEAYEFRYLELDLVE